MSRVISNHPHRVRLSFDGLWQFLPSSKPAVKPPAARLYRQTLMVPGPWEASFEHSNHRGFGWYRHAFELPGNRPVFPDNAAEGTETVTVALVAAPDPNAYIVGTLEPGELTIADDVAEVTLAIDDAEAAEAGQATASLSISRAGGDTGASLAVYLTISGSATAGSDYSMSGVNWLGGQSYYVVLSAAQLSLSLTLTPFPDNAAEGTEMVTAILAAAQGPPHDYTLGTVSMGELTIADDVAKVTLAIDDAVAAETDQSTASLSILRAGGDTGASLVVYLTISGSATGGTEKRGSLNRFLGALHVIKEKQ